MATVLMSAASAAGVMMGGLYRDPESLSSMLRGFDAVTLLLVVPSLAAALVGVSRRSPIAELIWVGLLAATAYTYAFHVFATAFNDLFLAHIAILSCSTFALVLALATLDVTGIGGRFGRRTPTRAISLFLAFLALGLGGMWIYHALRFAISDVVPTGSALVETDAVVHLGFALDLSLLVPAYVAASVLLWRRAAWGYVVAAAVLVSGVVHQVAYLVAMPFQANAGVPGAVAFDPAEPVIAGLFLIATSLLLGSLGRGGSHDAS